MPDFCLNNVTVTNNNPRVIERFVRAFDEVKLFDEFIPLPDGLKDAEYTADEGEVKRRIKKFGAKDCHEWRTRNWGTKWDTGRILNNRLDIIEPGKIKITMETAWAPPIPVFDHWVDIGCHVRARYSYPNEGTGTYDDKLITERSKGGSRKTIRSFYFRLLDELVLDVHEGREVPDLLISPAFAMAQSYGLDCSELKRQVRQLVDSYQTDEISKRRLPD
jgi:hypothetical protein